MSFEGYKSTTLGKNLIAKLLAGKSLEITKVVCGTGVCESEADVDGLTDLILPRMVGTSTEATYENQTMCMTVQFFSTENTGSEFELSEFGIYALDPDVGEILMYYFSQGDNPVKMFGASSKCSNIAQFPVAVFVGEDLEGVNLGYPPTTFLTAEALENHNTANDAHEKLMHPRIQLHVSPTVPTDSGVFLWIDKNPEGFVYPKEEVEEEVATSGFSLTFTELGK